MPRGARLGSRTRAPKFTVPTLVMCTAVPCVMARGSNVRAGLRRGSSRGRRAQRRERARSDEGGQCAGPGSVPGIRRQSLMLLTIDSLSVRLPDPGQDE